MRSAISQICLGAKPAVQLPMSAVNMTLTVFAAERRAAAPLLLSAGSMLHGAPPRAGDQQQTRRTPLLLSIDWKDGQTDGIQFLRHSRHTMRAVSATIKGLN